MTQVLPAIVKSPTKSPQPARRRRARPAKRSKTGGTATRVLANGNGRAATRGGGEVIELEHGITVYPAREENGRWRAVWCEDGARQQCEAVSEEKLAARLEKVAERLAAGATNMKRPGADLIAHYLDLDRLPVDERWSGKHAHTQRRLCERFAPRSSRRSPCHAPTASEGDRLRRCLSALVSAGLSPAIIDLRPWDCSLSAFRRTRRSADKYCHSARCSVV